MSGSPDEFRLKQMGNLMGRRRPKDGEQNLIESPSQDGPSTPSFVYVLAVFSALGGFLFGYDTGVVSGAMLPLKKEMNLNNLWQELLVSSTVGAAALSSLSGGYLNGWLGRRICILIASFIFSIGGVILGLAPNKEVLLAGRLTVGLGIGEFTQTFQSEHGRAQGKVRIRPHRRINIHILIFLLPLKSNFEEINFPTCAF